MPRIPNRYKYNSVDKRESECIDKYVSQFFNDDEIPVSDSNIDLNEYISTKWISSYTLNTLVLFEWSKKPEDEQWTGSNLTQRLVNILHNLLNALKKNKEIRSFWFKDYNVLPGATKAFLPGAINRKGPCTVRPTLFFNFLFHVEQTERYEIDIFFD